MDLCIESLQLRKNPKKGRQVLPVISRPGVPWAYAISSRHDSQSHEPSKTLQDWAEARGAESVIHGGQGIFCSASTVLSKAQRDTVKPNCDLQEQSKNIVTEGSMEGSCQCLCQCQLPSPHLFGCRHGTSAFASAP